MHPDLRRPRAQAAMEYLMTYGWAILVLAVVIAALSGIGVFSGSPAENACVASSGFTCTVPTLAGNGTLTAYFGELSQSTATITGVACTTNTSIKAAQVQSITPVTVQAGQKTLIGFLGCPIAANAPIGTQASGYLWVQYNLYGGTIVRVAQFKATVSNPGSSSSANAVGLSFLISNNKASATPAPFQQMITFNPSNSAYSANMAANLGNVRFYEGSSELNSWCELGCTSGSSNAVFWVRIPGGISASSNVVIVANTLSTATNYDGAYAGEAPQLSVTGTAPTPITITYTSASGEDSTGTNAVASPSAGAPLYICAGALSSYLQGLYNDGIGSTYPVGVQDGDADITAIGDNSTSPCGDFSYNYNTTNGQIPYDPAITSAISISGYTIYNLFTGSSGGQSTQTDLNNNGGFTVTTYNAFVVIAVSCGYSACDHSTAAQTAGSTGNVLLPAGCSNQTVEDADGYETTLIATCKSLTPGSYDVYANNNGHYGGAEMALAAYVFQNVTPTPVNYGEFDNGGQVFNYYNNFATPSTISGWGNGNSSSIAIGGLTVLTSPGSNWAGLSSSTTYSIPFIDEEYVANVFSSAFFADGLSPSSIVGSNQGGYNVLALTQGEGGSSFGGYYYKSGNSQNFGNCGSSSQDVVGIPGITFFSNYTVKIGFSSSAEQFACSLSATALTPGPSYHLFVGGSAGAGRGGTVYWVRLRAIPPNDIMPTVTQGSFT